jgi:hypothetical protein
MGDKLGESLGTRKPHHSIQELKQPERGAGVCGAWRMGKNTHGTALGR